MKKRVSMKKRFTGWVVISLFAFALTGCSQAEEEKEVPVLVVSDEEQGIEYSMSEVMRGNVSLTMKFNCKYMQTKEQAVCFQEGGKTIEKIYVREGDYVKPGDILAEVSTGSLEEEIAALEYKIQKDALEKQYLDVHEEFDLRSSYFSFVYGTKCEEEDLEEYEERDEEILDSYQNKREDFSDEAEFDIRELEALKKELSDSRICATMSGMVYSVEPNLEGTISKKGEVIMTVIDGTEGVFEMEKPEYADVFSPDDVLKLEVYYGTAKGIYDVVPYEMQSWGEKQYFSIYDGPENDGIEVETTGDICVVLDTRENVLVLPNSSVFSADGKSYVYMLDENNMKTVCFVETGLKGDEYTEIVSGLNEGDMVVRR